MGEIRKLKQCCKEMQLSLQDVKLLGESGTCGRHDANIKQIAWEEFGALSFTFGTCSTVLKH